MKSKLYLELVNKAIDEYNQHNLDEALNNLLEAEKIYADNELLIDIALIYDELNEYDMAITYYHKVLDHDINYARAYYGLGIIFDHLKRYDEAKAYYKEAIDMNENYYEAHFFLANIYDDEKDISLAIYHYKKVIEISPDYFYAYLNLGAMYENLNENEVALDYLLKAKELNDHNHLLHFNLGVVYRKLNCIEDSIESYERSLGISFSHAFTFLNLAIIYKDDFNNLNKSIEIYSEGIKHHPNEAVLTYNRACAYALLEEYDKAITDLEQAVKLDSKLKEYLFKDDELDELRKLPLFRKTF